jgi:hypothetical protein
MAQRRPRMGDTEASKMTRAKPASNVRSTPPNAVHRDPHRLRELVDFDEASPGSAADTGESRDIPVTQNRI